MKEMQVRSLGQENPLEEEMAIHSSILPGKSHGQRSLVGYKLKGLKLVGHDLVAEYARTHDEYNCTLFSLQYTLVLYEYTRFYLSSVQLIEIGNVFSFF